MGAVGVADHLDRVRGDARRFEGPVEQLTEGAVAVASFFAAAEDAGIAAL